MRLQQDVSRTDLWRAYAPDGSVAALGQLEITEVREGEDTQVVFSPIWVAQPARGSLAA